MEALVPASMEIASPWSARSTALFIWEADTVPPLTPALPEELEPEEPPDAIIAAGAIIQRGRSGRWPPFGELFPWWSHHPAR